jgi:glucose-6-phosphate isomerase
MNEVEGSAVTPTRWLIGLRRAQVASGALDRWIDEHGVTGAAWDPGSWVASDSAEAIHNLVAAGARPDASLLNDLVVTDVRAAAQTLRRVDDGYVAVWMDPDRLVDPGRAGQGARALVNELGRPNVAVAFAWTGARAGAVSAIVGAGVPVALTGAWNPQTLDAVATARSKAMDRLRRDADDDDDVDDIPVFALGADSAPDGVVAVELVSEDTLLRPGSPPTVRLPDTQEAERSAWAAAVERLERRAIRPAHDDTYSPKPFADDVARELMELDRAETLERIWKHDHTVWRDDPTEIADRLGWLDVARRMRAEVDDLTAFGHSVRSDGVNRVVLLGMGGSSLAPEMFRSILGGAIALDVVDTTDPDQVAKARDALDRERTLVIVSSKSGTTIETHAALELFWSVLGRGDRFVAITDPGSELATLARERGFRRVFENPPDIGGRYSALSYFGLVPAAVCGIDLSPLLDGALEAMHANAASVPALAAPAARLGAAIAEAAAGDAWDGRDKLTLVLPPELAALGSWIEQLVAESLGKESKGVLPVDGEPLGPPDVYDVDRVFVAYALGDAEFPSGLADLEEADHPVIRIRLADTSRLGAECFRWMLAIAVIGHTLDIHPFDQPDVESAKVRAREILEGRGAPTPERGSAPETLDTVEPHDYIAIQAFLTPDPDTARRLQEARIAFRDHYKVATTVGFGPRFLHSTGQFHKGGPPSGVFLQVTKSHTTDVDVPALGFTFGRLFDAQADGDLQALRDAGRRAARLSLDELEALVRALPPREREPEPGADFPDAQEA